MMARRLPGVLPPMTFEEALEVQLDSLRRRYAAGRRRPARRAPFQSASPHDLGRRTRWRRQPSTSWRNQPCASRCALPRRDARVRSARPERAAAAARRRVGGRGPRGTDGALSCTVCARRRHESVPVRIPRASQAGMPLHTGSDRPILWTAVGSTARSDRPGRRRAGCRDAVPLGCGGRRIVGRRAGARSRGAQAAGRRGISHGAPTRGSMPISRGGTCTRAAACAPPALRS